jgi:hypothetical protein
MEQAELWSGRVIFFILAFLAAWHGVIESL